MIKQKILFVLISISSLHCLTTKQLTEEDIYARILKEHLGQSFRKGEKIKSVVLNTEIKNKRYGMELSYDDIGTIASASIDLLIIDEKNHARPDTAKIDLLNKFENNRTRKLVNLEKIKLPYKIELLSPQAINSAFKEDVEKGWREFYKKRPKSFGIVEVSNLVFSDNNRFCILYVGYMRRGLHGYGCLLIVDLYDKDLITAEIELWVS